MKTGAGKTGRPISFDKDAALEAAMLLFWERGFEGTSMADLTQAMGLNPSSIYAAFGDKHALFQLAVQRYLDSRAQYAVKALEEPTLERVIRALFDNTVAFLTTPGHPPTCMTLAGAMGCSVDAAPARDLMAEIRRQNEVAIRERLQRAQKSGEFAKDINADDFTRYLSLMRSGTWATEKVSGENIRKDQPQRDGVGPRCRLVSTSAVDPLGRKTSFRQVAEKPTLRPSDKKRVIGTWHMIRAK
jgi:AcrR family transcriptional regulator